MSSGSSGPGITSVTQKSFEESVCRHSSIGVKITSPVHYA